MRRKLIALLCALGLMLAVAGTASADTFGANGGCPAHNGHSQIGSCGNGQQPPPND